uniref:Unique cartilage matrix-associated protein n=1 Tax=Gasterosteus aculeatus TaxID=69293 RepID=G3Q617_GASAC
MSWTRVFVLSLLTTLLILTREYLFVGSWGKVSFGKLESFIPLGAARQVFVPESDAANFFKRRSRRSTRYYELQAEQRVRLSVYERRREYSEEQRDEYDNYVKEERDAIEQNERSRETNEQLREYHYDGYQPRY